MRLKLKPIFLGLIIIIGMLSVQAISINSSLDWYVGTLKSELWAAIQQPGLQSPKTELQTSSKSENQAALFPDPHSPAPGNNREKSLAFPLGWYSSVDYPDALKRMATEEINFVVPYTGKSDVKKVKTYLDRASAAGIQVMVEIPRLEVRRDHRWLITQFVKQLKDHPALHSWYLYDEPEYVKLSPRLLERVYQAIKTEDPKHNVAIAFGKLNRVEKYLKALDTILYFNYPCYYDSPQFCNLESSVFGQLTANIAPLVQEKDNFWMVLQGYGEDKYGRPTQNNRRLPTIEEERYMIYSSILAQANGLLFWTHYRSQQFWIDSVLTPLLEELQNYLPAITSQKTVPQAFADRSTIQARLFRHPQDNSLLLIALNQSSEVVETEIVLKPRIQANYAQVIREERAITLNQGRLTDAFEPFAVHIYQIQ
ncbi:MAG: hypothetical protein AAFO95_18030 [Cyanobacteria bacterium J06600_6]